LPNSNVREVLASLDEITGETRMMPAPPLPPPPSNAPPQSAPSQSAPPVTAPPADDPSFTDTQVLKFLETRRADGTQGEVAEAETGAISLLKPDDTGTRRALKQAVTSNAPVSFAVQLQWSVQPVELQKVPPLAIFSAYTLYTVEGSRDGRKWYGLRLGFFTDAIAAKQVAYYVRSEFTSVAVVPVSPQERARASNEEQRAAQLAFPKKAKSGPADEFKLIDPDQTADIPAAAPKPGPPRVPPRVAPGSAGAGPRVRARERRGPQTLEETLEILGASQLQIDDGSGDSLSDSGVRHLQVEVQKNTPFTRLLERLSERVRKG
jgi:hypothetical protein